MARIAVDPQALRGLADRAAGLADELGTAGQAPLDGAEAALGDPGLAAALAAFDASWRARCDQVAAELADASTFLHVVADAVAGADRDLAAGGS